LFIIKAAIGIRDFLKRITRSMLPASYIMLEEISGIWKVKALNVAACLGIAEILKNGPQKIENLAEITSSDSQSLYRVLRALAGEGIFKELPGKVFENTRLSEALCSPKESVKYFAMHHLGSTNWELAGDMLYCVKTGKNAFEHKFNTKPFGYLESHPEENDIFNRAMTETAELSGDILVSSYPFWRYNTIVDIGGGQGLFLAQIIRESEKSNGILFDQPHVVDRASENFKKQQVENRCSIVPGSFLESIPRNGDLYIMKNILHDWCDDEAIRILKNIRQYMPGNAKLLLIETIIKPDNKPSFGKFVDLQMLMGTEGGRERTLEEFRNILINAGFMLARIIDNATPFSFIEASKAD